MAKIGLTPFSKKYLKDGVYEYLENSGVSALSDHELVAFVLGISNHVSDKIELREMVAKVLSVLDKSNGIILFNDLMLVEGLHESQAAALLAGMEISRRVFYPAANSIDKPIDVYHLLHHMADRLEENFFCITLNGAQEVMKIHHISKGLTNRAIVHPREVFACAISDRATAIVVAHNHPSGNVAPSEGDREVTKRLLQSGSLLGIPLLDHVIFSQKSFFSFLDNQELN